MNHTSNFCLEKIDFHQSLYKDWYFAVCEPDQICVCVCAFLSAAEMSIINEYERNLQFEQQYISSLVEGMDEMHIVCPICHM